MNNIFSSATTERRNEAFSMSVTHRNRSLYYCTISCISCTERSAWLRTDCHCLHGTQQFNTVFARNQALYEVFGAVFGLMMPCRLVHNYRRFGGSMLPKSSRQEMEATNSSNTLLAHSLTKCSQELAIGCHSAST